MTAGHLSLEASFPALEARLTARDSYKSMSVSSRRALRDRLFVVRFQSSPSNGIMPAAPDTRVVSRGARHPHPHAQTPSMAAGGDSRQAHAAADRRQLSAHLATPGDALAGATCVTCGPCTFAALRTGLTKMLLERRLAFHTLNHALASSEAMYVCVCVCVCVYVDACPCVCVWVCVGLLYACPCPCNRDAMPSRAEALSGCMLLYSEAMSACTLALFDNDVVFRVACCRVAVLVCQIEAAARRAAKASAIPSRACASAIP